jgi:DNA primase
VGFGGRILGKGEPKYLNSPETRIFHKGSMLYNLHEAKQAIRREEEVILVEGYFDVIRLVLAGIEHVVAPLGTALTQEQAALLRRFSKAALLLYDSDSAGLKATFRAGDECLRHGMRVKVATLPEGEDPDTLVRRGGADALLPILRDAVDVLDRKIQLLERKGWFEGLEHRRDALDRLLPTARAASDPIARDLYLARISERTGVSRAVLEREESSRPPPPPESSGGPARRTPAPALPARSRYPGAKLEQQLLKTILSGGTWLERARAEVPAESFEVPSYREIFDAVRALPHGSPPGAALEGLSPQAQDAFQRLLQVAVEERAAGVSFDEEFVGALQELRARSVVRSLAPVSAVDQRQHQLKELLPDQRKRIAFRKAAANEHRRPPSGPSGPDPTPHS